MLHTENVKRQKKSNRYLAVKPLSQKKTVKPLHHMVKLISPPKDYPWEVLRLLALDLDEHLSEDESALLSQIIRDRDFDSYLLLSDLWGLQNLSTNSADEALSSLIPKVRAKYQLSSLLKKFRFPASRRDQRASAMKKFFLAEEQCREFNKSGYISAAFSDTEAGACILTYARGFIQKVIGTVCPDLEILTGSTRHGPGANLDTVCGQSNIYFKYENWPYSVTEEALPFARFLIATDDRWIGALEDSYRSKLGISKLAILNQKVFWSSVFKVVDYNRITTVPKNAQTERTIAIEPSINLMLQLGVDGFIRSRLKKWDVNLDDQSKNQRLSRLGSLIYGDESYVTLDLSAASDTISKSVVKLLLPPDWYAYLTKLRASNGLIGKENSQKIVYEKFSSMGNGFTFALESLIFSALCYAVIKVREGTVSPKTDFCVYGDDIIVRKKHAQDVIKYLQIFGFKLNVEKSFLHGPIRESCGADWFHGYHIRPVQLVEPPKTVFDLYVDHNRLKRMLWLRFTDDDSKVLSSIKSWIPKALQLRGPYDDEDFDSYLHSKERTYYSNCVWKYRRLTRQPISENGSKCQNFLMRKLMHRLADKSGVSYAVSWRHKVSSGGSQFTVLKPQGFTVGQTYSIADIWRDQYAEKI